LPLGSHDALLDLAQGLARAKRFLRENFPALELTRVTMFRLPLEVEDLLGVCDALAM
jgi:hypothetical protein